MILSLKSASGGGDVPVGSVIEFNAAFPIDYTDSTGARYLRQGYFELDPNEFDENLWAGSVGTVFFPTTFDEPVLQSNNNQNTSLHSINDKLFIKTSGSMVFESDDGFNWNEVQVTNSRIPTVLNKVLYLNNTYVFLGSGSTAISYSEDVPNMVIDRALSVDSTANIRSAATDGNVIAAVGSIGEPTSSNLSTWVSSDGISWTQRTHNSVASLSESFYDVIYDNVGSRFIAVGRQTTEINGAPLMIYTSINGDQWSPSNISASATISSTSRAISLFQNDQGDIFLIYKYRAADSFNILKLENDEFKTFSTFPYTFQINSTDLETGQVANGYFYLFRHRTKDFINYESLDLPFGIYMRFKNNAKTLGYANGSYFSLAEHYFARGSLSQPTFNSSLLVSTLSAGINPVDRSVTTSVVGSGSFALLPTQEQRYVRIK